MRDMLLLGSDGSWVIDTVFGGPNRSEMTRRTQTKTSDARKAVKASIALGANATVDAAGFLNKKLRASYFYRCSGMPS